MLYKSFFDKQLIYLIDIWQMFNVGTDAITDKPYIQDKKDHLNEFVANVLRDNIG